MSETISHRDAYEELSCYTLAHGHPSFIHQHVVDAFAAQEADENTKPIALTFALAGLYLHVERGLSGRQVQLAHMKMAQRKRQWPAFSLPRERGTITAAAVIKASPGTKRDQAIDGWCASVWEAFRGNREVLVRLLAEPPVIRAADDALPRNLWSVVFGGASSLAREDQIKATIG